MATRATGTLKPRRPAWRAYLLLSRISNLPTIWTNVLAGVVVAGGALPWPLTALLIAAISLLYTGGMFLNDAFDRDFDATHIPERPLPAGDVTVQAALATGFSLLAAGLIVIATLPHPSTPLLWGSALAGAIVLYDTWHKRNPFGPLLMGVCRGLVYVVAGTAVAGAVMPPTVVAAALLVGYVVALTWIAKRLGPRAGIVVPILIAGICLFDAAVIAISGGGAPLACAAATGFAVTLLLQRYVPGT